MTFGIRVPLGLACVILLFTGTFHTALAQSAVYGPHLWDKPLDPGVFEKRVNEEFHFLDGGCPGVVGHAFPASEVAFGQFDDTPAGG